MLNAHLVVILTLITVLSQQIAAIEDCYFYDDAVSFYGYYGKCESGCCGSAESQRCCNGDDSIRTECIICGTVFGLLVFGTLCYICRTTSHCTRNNDGEPTTEQAVAYTEVSASCRQKYDGVPRDIVVLIK